MIPKFQTFGLFLSLAVLLAITSSTESKASFGMISWSTWESNSWVARLEVGTVYAELMEVFVVADTGAGPFKEEGLANLNPGWSTTAVTSTYVEATGPSAGNHFMDIHFAGESTGSVTLDFVWWRGGGYGVGTNALDVDYGLTTWRAHWSNKRFVSGTLIDSDVDAYQRQNPIPETSSVVLLGIGLGLAGVLAGRRRWV